MGMSRHGTGYTLALINMRAEAPDLHPALVGKTKVPQGDGAVPTITKLFPVEQASSTLMMHNFGATATLLVGTLVRAMPASQKSCLKHP
jgi:hypothetical protein